MWGSKAVEKKDVNKDYISRQVAIVGNWSLISQENSGKSFRAHTLHSYSNQGKRELVYLHTNSCYSL